MYGIQHIATAKKGTGNTTPANVNIFGTRNNEELTIKDIAQEDTRGGSCIIGKRFETPIIEDRQPSLLKLQNIFSVYGADRGCDAEIKTESGDLFQFIDTKYIGVKGRYEMTPEKRILGVQLGVSLEKSAGLALIDAADSASALVLGITNHGINPAVERYPFPASYHPTLDVTKLIDYSFLLEEDGEEEKVNGRHIQKFIQSTLELTFDDQSIADMVADMNESAGMSIYFRQNTAASTFEKFTFAQYALRKTSEIKIGVKDRYIKQTYKRKFPRSNMTFSFTNINGGGTSADGTEGGTVTIAA